MKTFQLSKKDLEFMTPVDANLQALNVALQVYVINNIYPRLALQKDAKSRYDIAKGELYVFEEKDLTPTQPPKEVAKEEPKADTEAVKPEVSEPKPVN